MGQETVCFYVYGFPPDYSGATAQAIFTADHLRERGVKSFFLTYAYDRKVLPITSYAGHRVIRFLRERTAALARYHLALLAQLFRLRREFTILYLNGNDGQFWTAFWTVIFARMFGKKIFMELNMELRGDPLSIAGTRCAALKRLAARGMTAYISNSRAITKAFTRAHPAIRSMETISYAVDARLFRPELDPAKRRALRNRLGLPQEARIAMTCGAVIRRKGIDFLLDCWQEILARYAGPCVFVIVGPCAGMKVSEGACDVFTRDVARRVRGESLKGKVFLTGQVDNAHEYFQASDLFLFAGRQEGSPSTIREAMASALPVISLDLPDITEDVIDNGESGVIIYPDDYGNLRNWQTEPIKGEKVKRDFVEAALTLMNDPERARQMGAAARKKAEEIFSFDIKAEKYVTLFTGKA